MTIRSLEFQLDNLITECIINMEDDLVKDYMPIEKNLFYHVGR